MTEQDDLIDRLKRLEHRSREFERQSREEIQALQQQLGAALDQIARTPKDTVEPHSVEPAARSIERIRSRQRRPKMRSSSGRQLPAPERNCPTAGGSPAPPRIPGVRIAYIGGRQEPVARIRAYWEERGAVFMHHEEERSRIPLDQVLARADVVFYPVGCIRRDVALRLEVSCERLEKPLIPLHNAGMSGLRRALGHWCPLT